MALTFIGAIEILSYLSFFGVYLLSVIDANVDAHMKFFDANEDISLRMIPPNWGRSREVLASRAYFKKLANEVSNHRIWQDGASSCESCS